MPERLYVSCPIFFEFGEAWLRSEDGDATAQPLGAGGRRSQTGIMNRLPPIPSALGGVLAIISLNGGNHRAGAVFPPQSFH